MNMTKILVVAASLLMITGIAAAQDSEHINIIEPEEGFTYEYVDDAIEYEFTVDYDALKEEYNDSQNEVTLTYNVLPVGELGDTHNPIVTHELENAVLDDTQGTVTYEGEVPVSEYIEDDDSFEDEYESLVRIWDEEAEQEVASSTVRYFVEQAHYSMYTFTESKLQGTFDSFEYTSQNLDETEENKLDILYLTEETQVVEQAADSTFTFTSDFLGSDDYTNMEEVDGGVEMIDNETEGSIVNPLRAVTHHDDTFREVASGEEMYAQNYKGGTSEIELSLSGDAEATITYYYGEEYSDSAEELRDNPDYTKTVTIDSTDLETLHDGSTGYIFEHVDEQSKESTWVYEFTRTDDTDDVRWDKTQPAPSLEGYVVEETTVYDLQEGTHSVSVEDYETGRVAAAFFATGDTDEPLFESYTWHGDEQDRYGSMVSMLIALGFGLLMIFVVMKLRRES